MIACFIFNDAGSLSLVYFYLDGVKTQTRAAHLWVDLIACVCQMELQDF